jgi:hypothetical protein
MEVGRDVARPAELAPVIGTATRIRAALRPRPARAASPHRCEGQHGAGEPGEKERAFHANDVWAARWYFASFASGSTVETPVSASGSLNTWVFESSTSLRASIIDTK